MSIGNTRHKSSRSGRRSTRKRQSRKCVRGSAFFRAVGELLEDRRVLAVVGADLGLIDAGLDDALMELDTLVKSEQALGKNIPLDALTDWLVGLAPNGIIEFVPKEDPMVQQLLSLRADIFPHYTKETFVDLLRARARIVRSDKITGSGRTLFWYARD